ncbi:MAG: ATP synthase F0 subunit A [Planctomycetota bacterium]|nr:MAG: ATP synthase F0 subunit A [Planctomycetota bacterium]
MFSSLSVLAAASPADHVYNHKFWVSDNGYWLWSGNQGNLVLSLLIIILVGAWFARQVKTGPASEGADAFVTKNRFAHAIEVICVYLREEFARPLLGARTDKLMPFLWTIFWFILVNNLLGLVPILDIVHLANKDWKAAHAAPIGGTATQNIWVTGVLAVIAMLFFNLSAIRHLGVVGFFKHMTAGAPFPASIVVFFLELLGQFFIKPFALALRLFANMTAGHILLATLFSFAGMVVGKGIFLQGPVTLISVLGGFGIMLLELFVAFMQAFIFMFLVTVFIALMDHDHDEHHDHAHDHHDPVHGDHDLNHLSESKPSIA